MTLKLKHGFVILSWLTQTANQWLDLAKSDLIDFRTKRWCFMNFTKLLRTFSCSLIEVYPKLYDKGDSSFLVSLYNILYIYYFYWDFLHFYHKNEKLIFVEIKIKSWIAKNMSIVWKHPSRQSNIFHLKYTNRNELEFWFISTVFFFLRYGR